MTLNDYLQQKNIRVAHAAKAFGVDWITVWRWLNKGVRPRPDLMVKIQEWSGGAVTPNDWIKASGVAA